MVLEPEGQRGEPRVSKQGHQHPLTMEIEQSPSQPRAHPTSEDHSGQESRKRAAVSDREGKSLEVLAQMA